MSELAISGTSAMEVVPVLTAEQEAASILAEAMSVLTLAKAIVIKIDSDYRYADSACAAIKAAMKKSEAARDEWVRPLNTTVKKINAGFKDAENAFNAALAEYRRPMTAYQTELARLRKIEEDKAAAEQKRLEAEAHKAQEAARAALAAAQEEANALKAKAVELDPFDQILAEEEAAAAEAAAVAAAEAVKQSIRDTRAIEVIPEYVPKVTGSGSKTFTVWTYEIVDPALVPMSFRPINEALIAAEVKASKGSTSIPGVTVSSHQEVK